MINTFRFGYINEQKLKLDNIDNIINAYKDGALFFSGEHQALKDVLKTLENMIEISVYTNRKSFLINKAKFLVDNRGVFSIEKNKSSNMEIIHQTYSKCKMLPYEDIKQWQSEVRKSAGWSSAQGAVLTVLGVEIEYRSLFDILIK